jgi:hypothetical protein
MLRLAALAGALALPCAAFAADGNGWTFTAVPYVWVVTIDGKSAQFGLPPTDLHVSDQKLIDHLRAGVMFAGEARRDRATVYGDLFYVRLGANLSAPAPAGLQVQETMATVGAGYTVLRGPAYQVDAMAGARIWSLNTRVTFHGGPLTGVAVHDGATWIDALIGAKAKVLLSHRFFATGTGQVGGGAAGTRLTWDATAGLGCQLSKKISLLAGYRAAGSDHRRPGFVYDIVQHGPYLGLGASY